LHSTQSDACGAHGCFDCHFGMQKRPKSLFFGKDGKGKKVGENV
jgi:hypothetical protein